MKRGAPLQRTTRLTRKTPLKPRGKGKYARRPRDTAYMTQVSHLPCVVPELTDFITRRTPCRGRIEVDHVGDRATGQKSLDVEVCSICSQHHRERTDVSGAFEGMRAPAMRTFRHQAIALTKKRLLSKRLHAEWRSMCEMQNAALKRWERLEEILNQNRRTR